MPIRQRFRKIFSRNNDTPTPNGPSRHEEQLTPAPPANIQASDIHVPNASVPERLWDEAYDALKIQDAALIQAYEKILSRHLCDQGIDSPVTDSEENIIVQDNALTRRTQMRRLIDQGLNKTAREAKIKETIGMATQFINSAKDIISSAIQTAPQAALAWTGVCVALEIIQNPIAATDANRNGIEYVIKRMDWYWKLSNIVLKESSNDIDLGSIRRELETQLIDLYKSLLLYEIKSVCSYYRSRGLALLRDTAKLDDWNGDMRAIQDAERVFNDGSNTLTDLKMASNLEKLVIYAETQSTSQMTKEDQQCMKDLRLTDPSADKKRIEQTKGGLLQESYRWVLDNPEYQHWHNNEESHLLWIKGDPGKGKTMLLCGIIDELDQQSIRSGTTHTIYFFCQATDHQLNNATAILRGLIFMLINKQPSLISHLRRKYDQAGRKLFEGSNTWIILSDIFADILQNPALKSTYLVIDALDECISDLQKLLDLIVDTSSTGGRVKWIVSSRNWSQIEERLRRTEQKAKLSLELNAESISNAVDIYIREKVLWLASLKDYDKETCDAVRTYLSGNANDTFLWVALVCQNLEKYQRWKVLRILGEFPPGLDSLYKRMMNQVLSMDDASDVSLCKRILATMTSVYRPITLAELGRLIDIPSEFPNDIKNLEEIVALCGSFLTIRGDTIYFVHQSAKDHLTSNEEATSAIFPPGSGDVHLAILSRSIQAMEAVLRNNIYSLSYFNNFIDTRINIPNPDPLYPIRYSCVHWVDHLCKGNASKISAILGDDGIVDLFIRKHFLHWLESLGLLHHVSDGAVSITKLVSLLAAQSPQGKLFDFLQDAQRFIFYNKRAIEIAPIQIYSSALLFSPMKSLVRKAFLHNIPSWIYSRPINEDQWSPCLQTLEGHQGLVNSLGYLNNNQIVSASTDGTIKIWDTATGTCVRSFISQIPLLFTLTPLSNGRIIAGSFGGSITLWDLATGGCAVTVSVSDLQHPLDWIAPLTNSWIATKYSSGIIKIWDLETKICIQTLERHTSGIHSLAVLANGNVVSGSSDCTIRIWDIASGECIQTIDEHGLPTDSVASLSDGRIISGSVDMRVRIWDIATGKCVQTLGGHAGGVSSIASSTDGRIASGSWDRTIKIWDAATGTCTRTLKGHTGPVGSVIFLDDDRLASGSEDGTIKIWDITTNVDVPTPRDHPTLIKSLVISEDGHFVLGAEEYTIRIWDMATGRCVQVLEDHARGFFLSVTFLEDSRRVISCTSFGCVQIWDVVTGACVKKLGLTSGRVIDSATFSPDSQHVAISNDKRVEVWDVAASRCIYTLQGLKEYQVRVTFSPNGKYIASRSGARSFPSQDPTIKLWDTATGMHVQTLEHDDTMTSVVVAFSSDARYIASLSTSGSVKIWHLASGVCFQECFIGRARYLSFDTTTNSRLYCDFGALDLDLGLVPVSEATPVSDIPLAKASSPHFGFHGYGIDRGGEWIVKNGKPMLWLPPEHRARECHVKGSTVVVGCESGHVLILRFSESGPDS